MASVRTADRDRYLSTLYAPAPLRPALFALHALDLELAKIVATASEPMIAEIRLAWWRDALTGLDAGRIPAQPLLASLAAEVLPRGVGGTVLAGFEDAFLAQLHGEDAQGARGAALFAAAATVLGGDAGQARDYGRVWRGAATMPTARASRALRPLAGLAAIGGRADPPGSLGRQAIMLRVNLFGR